jgi:hypothetical protein
VAYFTLAPDWVCKVLSKGTAKVDRSEKLPAIELDLGVLWADVVLCD